MFFENVQSKYTHTGKYDRISNPDGSLHQFSIVAIKDTFHRHPNRFLLYYDEAWDCKFFFSYRTLQVGNEENIIERLSNELKIEKKDISLEYKSERCIV